MNRYIAQTQSQPDTDGETSLEDLWQMLIEGWRWIVGGTAASVIAATGYLAVTPPQYEAVALVRIGQIGQVGQIGQIGATPIEPLVRVVERIMFPTFKSAMVTKMGWGDDSRGAVYSSSLKASVVKGDLLELRVRGLTREDANSALDATIEHLAVLHKEVAQPATESLQAELKEILAEAGEVGKLQVELDRAARLQARLAPHDRFSESMLYAQLSTANVGRIRELRRREVQYREWISLTGKAATTAYTEPSVSAAPVSPRKLQTLTLATLGGLCLGVVAVLSRRLFHRQQ